MTIALVQTTAGLLFLFLAGELLVRGAVGIADRLRVPPLVIGLTVVAFGTSLPELFVSVSAVLRGAGGLAIGNVVGSNIANVWLILGASALVAPIACSARRLSRNLVVMLAASVLVIALSLDVELDRADSLMLVSGLVLFLLWSLHYARRHPDAARDVLEFEEELDIDRLTLRRAILYTLLGLLGLPFASDWLVTGAVTIARLLGVAEAVIGLTVVAIGTSLPELATSLMAARKGHAAVAIGNVIGSNLFNLLAILGISALVGQIPVPAAFLQVDFWVMLAASAMLLVYTLPRRPIGRLSGLAMLLSYALYLGWLMHDGRSLAYLTGMHP